jgi:hypothetical protein
MFGLAMANEASSNGHFCAMRLSEKKVSLLLNPFLKSESDMKKLIAAMSLFLAFTLSAHAQKTGTAAPTTAAPAAASHNDQVVRQTTDALVAKYSLNADQAKQMYTIQVRKERNMNEIAALKSSDPALYATKLQSVRKGTTASIRRILNTKEQVELYQKTQTDLRVKRAEVRKNMMAKNATQAEIEAAMLDIYAE